MSANGLVNLQLKREWVECERPDRHLVDLTLDFFRYYGRPDKHADQHQYNRTVIVLGDPFATEFPDETIKQEKQRRRFFDGRRAGLLSIEDPCDNCESSLGP